MKSVASLAFVAAVIVAALLAFSNKLSKRGLARQERRRLERPELCDSCRCRSFACPEPLEQVHGNDAIRSLACPERMLFRPSIGCSLRPLLLRLDCEKGS